MFRRNRALMYMHYMFQHGYALRMYMHNVHPGSVSMLKYIIKFIERISVKYLDNQVLFESRTKILIYRENFAKNGSSSSMHDRISTCVYINFMCSMHIL